MAATQETIEFASAAALAAQEKLATNIAVIDVSDVMAISEVFVLASADNERQVRAIVEEIEDALTALGQEPKRREGNRENRWVLLDYGMLIIHVQRNVERDFYGLDRLYRDCPLIEVEGVETQERPAAWAEDVDVRQVESLDEIPLAQQEPEE
ncbi:ribosome silencing factor [Corynebacterium sp. 153RC1]|uniref:ribosome silencing factor n=1 Tax=Corynebacterium TaxID=1716 RepID=UPI00211BD19E|nr:MULTISPECIES: ribosome silencing factor [unclassified Corynebacterium]MCQ9371287.1 ribosome silencing factor [Corynebacterium sp. 35RC1]MCQ9343214.1 ribosome silencing factor [Corynebacterium sp. 76QC2CO]MCQ9353244.1 ribosome silencing factor [Corynebacterium sp. 209RC1]MCQ9355384.1 ribosome silencing factor [Corynebacterium sp. 1222RC1]MCQ9357116.1 ribosome silencing factor [Corynebacterium sp. 122RC1]